jgi:hypothetical protein
MADSLPPRASGSERNGFIPQVSRHDVCRNVEHRLLRNAGTQTYGQRQSEIFLQLLRNKSNNVPVFWKFCSALRRRNKKQNKKNKNKKRDARTYDDVSGDNREQQHPRKRIHSMHDG